MTQFAYSALQTILFIQLKLFVKLHIDTISPVQSATTRQRTIKKTECWI